MKYLKNKTGNLKTNFKFTIGSPYKKKKKILLFEVFQQKTMRSNDG